MLWRALKVTEAAVPSSDAVVKCLEHLMVLLDKQGYEEPTFVLKLCKLWASIRPGQDRGRRWP